MSDETEDGLNLVKVRQDVRKTWSLGFPAPAWEPPGRSLFGLDRGRSLTMSSWTPPGREGSVAQFDTSIFGPKFTAAQLRVIGELCNIVADALDEEKS